MVKKIFDILPPESSPVFKEKKPLNFEKKAALQPKKSGIKIKTFWWAIIFVFITAGAVAYFNLSKAEIEIWLETEIENFETKLTVDKKAGNVDFSANLIPGISFQEEKIFSQEFMSTGKKMAEKKAEGVIRIFNDSQQDQILIAQTRFQPPLEKFRQSLEIGENPWFKTTQTIVIPAKNYRDVKVLADSPGEKYNIESSNFAVPGLAGTPQYTFVYGESFEAMKGGLKKELSEITQEDLEKAESALKEKATKEIKNALKNKIPSDFIFLEEQVFTEISEASSFSPVGSELEKFTFQLKAKTVTISFKREDLENFSEKFISSQIPINKKIDQKRLKIDYSPETVNIEAGKIVLSLNLEAKIYSDIDKLSLEKTLSGKSLTETQFFLQNQEEIKRAKVKFWPFWVKQVPQELEKINLKINID